MNAETFCDLGGSHELVDGHFAYLLAGHAGDGNGLISSRNSLQLINCKVYGSGAVDQLQGQGGKISMTMTSGSGLIDNGDGTLNVVLAKGVPADLPATFAALTVRAESLLAELRDFVRELHPAHVIFHNLAAGLPPGTPTADPYEMLIETLGFSHLSGLACEIQAAADIACGDAVWDAPPDWLLDACPPDHACDLRTSIERQQMRFEKSVHGQMYAALEREREREREQHT